MRGWTVCVSLPDRHRRARRARSCRRQWWWLGSRMPWNQRHRAPQQHSAWIRSTCRTHFPPPTAAREKTFQYYRRIFCDTLVSSSGQQASPVPSLTGQRCLLVSSWQTSQRSIVYCRSDGSPRCDLHQGWYLFLKDVKCGNLKNINTVDCLCLRKVGKVCNEGFYSLKTSVTILCGVHLSRLFVDISPSVAKNTNLFLALLHFFHSLDYVKMKVSWPWLV